jgi:hypothetical protein
MVGSAPPRGASLRHARNVAVPVLVAGLVAACGAFSLNSVVEEAGARDGAPPDATEDEAKDAAPADTEAGTDCAADADPCACLMQVTIATDIANVVAFAVSGDELYWVAQSGSGNQYVIYRLPIDSVGASNVPALTDPFTIPSNAVPLDELPFASDHIYLGVQNHRYQIATVDLDATAPIKAKDLTPSFPIVASEVRVGTKGVYWTDPLSEVCFAYLDGGLPVADPDSGCGGKPLAPAADGGASNNDLGVSGTLVYQSVYKTGEIRTVTTGSMASGVVRTILRRAPGEPRILNPVVGELFFSEPSADAGAIFRSLPDGGDLIQIVGTRGVVKSFSLTASEIYYAINYDPGGSRATLFSVSRDGGNPTLVACDRQPAFIAVDDTNIYWWSLDDNTVHRAAH